MQSTSCASAASSLSYCHRFLHFPRPHRTKKSYNSPCFPRNQILSKHICSLALPTTTNCCKRQQDHNFPFFDRLHSSTDSDTPNSKHPEAQNEENGGESDSEAVGIIRGLFTNMWWADLKAAVGHRINVEGIVSSAAVFTRDRHSALPHMSVPDIRYIDWAELHTGGALEALCLIKTILSLLLIDNSD